MEEKQADIDFKSILSLGVSGWNNKVAEIASTNVGLSHSMSVSNLSKIIILGGISRDFKSLKSIASIKTSGMSKLLYENSYITGAIIVGADIEGSTFVDTTLQDCIFYKCNIEGTSFDSAIFNRTNFIDCKFKQCNMSKTSFYRSRIADSKFSGGGLDGSRLYNTVFDKIAMVDTDCDGMIITDSFLNNLSLRSCSFKSFGADVSVLSVIEAYSTSFKDSMFILSKVINANLVKCSTAGMYLKGTLAHDLEKMPGVILEQSEEISETLSYISDGNGDDDDGEDSNNDDSEGGSSGDWQES